MDKINLNDKTLLVTGAAGFIGSNLVKRLLRDVKGATIIGIDNINDYYDVRLKEYRLSELNKSVPKGTIWEFIVRVMQGAPEHKKGEDGLPIII